MQRSSHRWRAARGAAGLLSLALMVSMIRPTPARADVGDPLEGLSAAHLTWFDGGLAAFAEVYTAETGLGPIFNADSCVACHSMPAPGGGSSIAVTRFGRDLGTYVDPLLSAGGPLLQSFAIDPACLETIPAQADVTAQRLTTPMFGAGLIESVSDEDIAERADPSDLDHDGVSGRVHLVQYPGRLRVGRFGWKSQEATLLSFSADALVSEMGITNALVLTEETPNGDTVLAAQCEALEGQDEPEDVTGSDGFSALVAVTNFARLLGPPSPQVRPRGRGWSAFKRARCTSCHVARMTTGEHTIPALENQRFYPYSDFLLHDMGTLGDGISQGAALPTEMRTAPLWGIGARESYLHDGRAATLYDAIMAHDGEASASRERFVGLPEARQTALIDFLSGL